MNGIEALAAATDSTARVPRAHRSRRARHHDRRQHDDRDERRSTASSRRRATATRSTSGAATRRTSGIPSFPPPTPIARRRHRFGIPERLDFRGNVVTPLDEGAVREAVRRLRRQGIESIAVCFLFSFLNPAHEKRVREIIAEEHPDARVSLSHEVMPTAPEFERTSTTLVDAYVGPKLSKYLDRLERSLRGAGYQRDLLIMQSNGGIMTADQLAKRAVAALGSGPTGGVIGACAVAARSGV
jgi:N-methylhydantoinase A